MRQDKMKIKVKAIELERLLAKYEKQELEVTRLTRDLSIFIEKAKSLNINESIEWKDIPGSRYFTEGNLRVFPDLEKAFADFRIELSGGEPLALRRLRERNKG